MIYLDTCLLIYVAEKIPGWRYALGQAMAAESEAQFAISPLVEMECLVGPLRRGDAALEAEFKAAFLSFARLDIAPPVFHLAASIRAQFGLKTPDAIHLACARGHKCRALWTADQRFHTAGPGFVRVISV